MADKSLRERAKEAIAEFTSKAKHAEGAIAAANRERDIARDGLKALDKALHQWKAKAEMWEQRFNNVHKESPGLVGSAGWQARCEDLDAQVADLTLRLANTRAQAVAAGEQYRNTLERMQKALKRSSEALERAGIGTIKGVSHDAE